MKKTSDRVLIVLGLFLLAFIVAMAVIFCVKGAVPDTLIQCTLGGGGLEALLLAGIKISKVIAGRKSGAGSPEASLGPEVPQRGTSLEESEDT